MRQLYDFFEGRGCRHQRLVRHFDERIEACGVACDRCLGDDVLGTGAAGARPPPRPRSRSPMAGPGDTSAIDGSDAAVFARLRALRRRLADERHVPAYVVFGDATLLEMAARRPGTEAELLAVTGVGPKKLALYGALFLAALRSP